MLGLPAKFDIRTRDFLAFGLGVLVALTLAYLF